MKKTSFIIAFASALLATISGVQAQDEGFAVLELFTSQGCSSCPPADKNLTDLGKEYENRNVHILAFHIDYWDYLGWKDTFSNGSFSKRQRRYANKRFQTGRVYTPQLVVNGVSEFNGSSREKSRRTVNKALSAKNGLEKVPAKSPKILDFKISGGTGTDRISFNMKLSKEISEEWDVNVALVQNNLKTQILRGENKGRTIVYNHVVQSFETLNGTSELSNGSINASKFKGSNYRLIAYLQNRKTMQIVDVKSVKP